MVEKERQISWSEFLDETRIYNKTLTQTEIQQLYTATTEPSCYAN